MRRGRGTHSLIMASLFLYPPYKQLTVVFNNSLTLPRTASSGQALSFGLERHLVISVPCSLRGEVSALGQIRKQGQRQEIWQTSQSPLSVEKLCPAAT